MNGEQRRPWTSHSFPQRRSNNNPFFARNNPHTHRVRHISGLLGAPICDVSNARPINEWNRQGGYGDIIEKHVQRLPVSLGTFKVREKAVPMIGMVPVTDRWREELRKLITALEVEHHGDKEQAEQRRPYSENVPASRQSSRCMQRRLENEFVRNTTSRQTSRQSGKVVDVNAGGLLVQNAEEDCVGYRTLRFVDTQETFDTGPLEYLVAMPDSETYIFQALAAVLQTDSVSAVQQWLVQAPSREKEVVAELLRAVAVANAASLLDEMQPRPWSTPETVYEDQLLQQEKGIDIDAIRQYNAEHRAYSRTDGQKRDFLELCDGISQRGLSRGSVDRAMDTLSTAEETTPVTPCRSRASRCSSQLPSRHSTSRGEVASAQTGEVILRMTTRDSNRPRTSSSVLPRLPTATRDRPVSHQMWRASDSVPPPVTVVEKDGEHEK